MNPLLAFLFERSCPEASAWSCNATSVLFAIFWRILFEVSYRNRLFEPHKGKLKDPKRGDWHICNVSTLHSVVIVFRAALWSPSMPSRPTPCPNPNKTSTFSITHSTPVPTRHSSNISVIACVPISTHQFRPAVMAISVPELWQLTDREAFYGYSLWPDLATRCFQGFLISDGAAMIKHMGLTRPTTKQMMVHHALFFAVAYYATSGPYFRCAPCCACGPARESRGGAICLPTPACTSSANRRSASALAAASRVVDAAARVRWLRAQVPVSVAHGVRGKHALP